ncbi:unnamed protein product, partial [marine sediment metagenome]
MTSFIGQCDKFLCERTDTEKYENDQTIKSVNPDLTPPPGKELSQEEFLMIALRLR